MEDKEWKVGDVVTIKGSTEPKMVISGIETKVGGVEAECTWFDNNSDACVTHFNVKCLKEVKNGGTV